MFHGRFGLPFLPFKTAIHTVIGKPIHVEKIEHPSADLVNRVHAEYCAGLVDLFDKYKDEFDEGRVERELNIL